LITLDKILDTDSFFTMLQPLYYPLSGLSRSSKTCGEKMGTVELVDGEEPRRINRSIHLKYLTPEALSDPSIASYLSEGDDVTVKVHMDELISWNLAGSKAGKALHVGGWFHPLDE
jgi:hypothetical protein